MLLCSLRVACATPFLFLKYGESQSNSLSVMVIYLSPSPMVQTSVCYVAVRRLLLFGLRASFLILRRSQFALVISGVFDDWHTMEGSRTVAVHRLPAAAPERLVATIHYFIVSREPSHLLARRPALL